MDAIAYALATQVQAAMPAAGWRALASMPSPVSNAAIGYVAGYIVVVGGNIGGSMFTTTGQLYDPVGNVWTTKTLSLSSGGWQLGSAAVGSLLWLIGGATNNVPNSSSASTVTWDPVANVSTVKVSLPAAVYGNSSAAANGKVTSVGNNTATSGSVIAHGTSYAIDTTANTVATLTGDPATARVNTAQAGVGSLTYVIGGWTATSTPSGVTESLDPVAGTWTTKATKPTAVGAPAGAAVGTSIFVIGGGTPGASTVVEVYDTVANVWSTFATLPGAELGMGAAADANGNLVVTPTPYSAVIPPSLAPLLAWLSKD